MSAPDPQPTTGTGRPTVPQGTCGCGHIEGVHLVAERGRGPCGATIGATRCPCPRFTPGGTALQTPAPAEPRWKVSRCELCYRPIIWAITINAKRMAVDSEPLLQGGDVQLEWRGEGVDPLARVLSTRGRFGKRNLRQAHVATCPHTGQRRSRTRSRA